MPRGFFISFAGMDQRFPKKEKLKSKKLIDELFANGKSVKAYPLVMIYNESELEKDISLKAGFSVSKKKIKKAVDRNKIKRRMREAYRINKAGIISRLPQKYTLMFICISGEMPSFKSIEESIRKLLPVLIHGAT